VALPDASEAARVVARAHQEEWALVVAVLARQFGDLDVAEEAAADAFATAVERWPVDGVPPNPGGWLMTTARRRALDRTRRDSRRDDKLRLAHIAYDGETAEPEGVIDDDRLRLLLTCCHPTLPMEARVALTLRMVGGLTVPEIARAFLVQQSTMGQRISRAKARVRESGVPYRAPTDEDLPERLAGVLAVLYLIFNEGYLASTADGPPIRDELVGEGIRLTRLLHDLMPMEAEVTGLLALMLLTRSRRAARVSADGELVVLAEQDRRAWDQATIAEALRLIDRATSAVAAPGRYLTLAAISATHAAVEDARHTDWPRILALYDRLARLDPSPIVQLNRAVAIAEIEGPEAAMQLLDGLEGVLGGYHAYLAVRADLARRCGWTGEARDAYDRAIAATDNTAERAYLTRRRDALDREAAPPTPGKDRGDGV
jgi:RNA polymerase sigma-70 factor (ECF subfamily)